MFEIGEEIITGNDKAFLLNQEQYDSLPRGERKFFRRAAGDDSIHGGRVSDFSWLFYPHGNPKIEIPDENCLRRRLPVYFERHLESRRQSLKRRSTRAKPLNWWGLSERRASWVLDGRPRIISKRAVGRGGFAIDPKAEFATVQGFARLPNPMHHGEQYSPVDLAHGYLSLLNSEVFEKILALYFSRVPGWDFAIDSKRVADLILPNLSERARDPDTSRLIFRLIELGREPCFGGRAGRNEIDQISATLYGLDFHDGE